MNPLMIPALVFWLRETGGCLRDLARCVLLVQVIRALAAVDGGKITEHRRGCEIQVIVYRRQSPHRRHLPAANSGPARTHRPNRAVGWPRCRRRASRALGRGPR